MTRKISQQKWQILKPHLEQLLNLPYDKQLESINLLSNLSSDDKKHLSALIQLERNANTFLEHPAIASLSFDNHRPPTANTIDRYEILREIGRGGMGTVYLAVRTDVPYYQEVAIKVLWSSREDELQSQRFRREQEVLARLEHPNIARIIDSGVSEEGNAYFVMEYVNGISLDRYIEQQNPPLERRLEIIFNIADIVRFAHQRLVIHRDLKPSNILIKEDGSIKLLDFGIAKLLDADEKLKLSRADGHPLTPHFSSPEQLQGKEITTATDVYQLGLVSYLILTGMPALDLQNKAMHAIVKTVCQTEPVPPSIRVMQQSDGKNSISPIDGKLLKGDIDSIVLKMLRIAPAFRYSSMEAMQQDIDAYFQSLPVSARKNDNIYRARKILFRHWRGISVASLLFITLLAYGLTTNYQAQQIEIALKSSQKEQYKVQKVSELLLRVFDGADPDITGLDGITAKQLLINGEDQIIQDLENLPEIQNHMLNVLAHIWEKQGEFDRVIKLLSSAHYSKHSPYQQSQSDYAKSLSLLGNAYLVKGDYAKALETTQQAIDLYSSFELKDEHYDQNAHGHTLLIHGGALVALQNHKESTRYISKAVTLIETAKVPNKHYLSLAFSLMAQGHHLKGEFTRAEENFKRAIELQAEHAGTSQHNYAQMLFNLAIFYRDIENFVEAKIYAKQANTIMRKLLGNQHPKLATGIRIQGVIEHRLGNLQSAKETIEDALGIEQSMRKNSYNSDITQFRLAEVLLDLQEFQQAKERLEPLLNRLNTQAKSGDMLGRISTLYGFSLYKLGHIQQAEQYYRKALSIMPKSSLLRTKTLIFYAEIELTRGSTQSAHHLINEALALRTLKFPLNHSWVLEAQAFKGVVLSELNQHDHARTILSEVLPMMTRSSSFKAGHKNGLLRRAQLAYQESAGAPRISTLKN